ncbi:MAG: sigma-70 family RNA polymerase sigma factor [Clostridia bacterium]|nr:sigma-70 family RNA polymerase sigma factor [Clostridia bacterium]
MQDRELLQLLESDAERGMAVLIDCYAGLVYAVIKAKLAPRYPADIEATVADTFSDFYLALPQFDPSRGSIRAYLCTIARHNAIDFLRQQNGLLPLEEAHLSEISTDDADKSAREDLLQAIRSMESPDREILLRKYYLGESSKAIAKALKMTPSAVDTRAHRAIQKLKKQFGGSV